MSLGGNEAKKLICIDPGHGGKDPGAIGPTGLKEAEVTLDLAHRVKAKLEQSYRVYLTRYDNDDDVSLDFRARKANMTDADLFVSIHCNAATNPGAAGTEAFHFPGSVQGERLATCVYEALIQVIHRRPRGVKDANFAVLRETRMPACLVEVAFISNPEEEALLKDDKFLDQAAEGIAQGIRSYAKGRRNA